MKMAVMCRMLTIHYSARSAWLSVQLCEWACSKITSGPEGRSTHDEINGGLRIANEVRNTDDEHVKKLASLLEK